MPPGEAVLGRLVWFNNRTIDEVRSETNPLPLSGVAWHDSLVAAHGRMVDEWTAFDSAGLRLPHISDLLTEDQGNEGEWRAGLLVADGRPVPPLVDLFPATTEAALAIPGIRAALLSALGPGAHIPSHAGPNAGVLRYHLGIVCGHDSALRVGDVTVPYRDAEGVLFDDTAEHEAWNRGDSVRVTLFCELSRPLQGARRALNTIIQRSIALDPRYRDAPARAVEWHRALNPRAG